MSLKIDAAEKQKIDKIFNVRPFEEAPLSKEPIDYLVLDAIDLSSYKEGPEGLESRQKLAAALEKCVTTYGFFYLVNHGITAEQFAKLRSLAQSMFELPQDIKNEHKAGNELLGDNEIGKNLGIVRGSGYKPRGHWILQNNVPDEIEHYNFRNMLHDEKFAERKYPDLIRAHLDEVAAYYQQLHNEVLRKLLTLCDIILEIPEGTLWENDFKVVQNDLRNSGSGFGRFMMYFKMNKDKADRSEGARLKGHTDASGFTFITSQPIAALQVRDYDTGEWRYVAHKENALVVNVGDALKFITGEYFVSSIHRVMAPPKDQEDYNRLNLIYFCDPKLSTVVDPRHLNSPKLQRLNKIPDWQPITFEQWDEEKGKLLNVGNSLKRKPTELFGRKSIFQLDTKSDLSEIKAN